MSYKAIIILVVSIALLGGAYALGRQSIDVTMHVSPLVIASCPDLQPITSNTFGSTTQMLIANGLQYRKCQAACLAQ